MKLPVLNRTGDIKPIGAVDNTRASLKQLFSEKCKTLFIMSYSLMLLAISRSNGLATLVFRGRVAYIFSRIVYLISIYVSLIAVVN